MQNQKKNVEVVAAVIMHNQKILCVQRGENKFEYISKKFEFPGGKIEGTETKKQTIIREIKEELNMDIIPVKELKTVEHEYPDFNLTMHSFISECISTEVYLSEHIDYKWLSVSELETLDWAAADLPIVEQLINS
jgi:8-oxo-dGTP diphosphatase